MCDLHSAAEAIRRTEALANTPPVRHLDEIPELADLALPNIFRAEDSRKHWEE